YPEFYTRFRVMLPKNACTACLGGRERGAPARGLGERSGGKGRRGLRSGTRAAGRKSNLPARNVNADTTNPRSLFRATCWGATGSGRGGKICAENGANSAGEFDGTAHLI